MHAVLQEVYYMGCAKIDTHKPKYERKFNVPAIRSENLPHKVFHNLLTSGGFDILNQAKTFMGKREKATLLYLNGGNCKRCCQTADVYTLQKSIAFIRVNKIVNTTL